MVKPIRLQKLCLLLCCMLIFCAANAQQITVRGQVVHADSALANATIQVKGTEAATQTDANGNFTITAAPNATLVITSVGFNRQEVALNGRSTITVQLQSFSQQLNEVVVIGYGTARKRDVVGSVDVVSAREAGANPNTSPAQLLVGKAAGVQVVNTSGVPGSGAQIIIRGTGSFTSVEPLYVIDGIQGNGNLFNTISPQDIDNITVLKDASSTAIYGSAAANGVVIVTTKRARSGAPRITVSSQWGVAKAWKQLDLLKAKDYVALLQDVAASKNVSLPSKFNTPGVLVDSTDWQKEIFRTALVSENNVNLSGGSDKVLYNLSVGYIAQQAIVKNYDNRRLNVRFGLEENLGRFRFGQTLNIRATKSKGQLASIISAIGYAPYKRVYDPNIPGGYSILSNVEDFSDVGNPLQGLGVNQPSSNEYVFYPQLFGEVALIKGLRFRSQFSATIGSGSGENFQVPYTASNFLTFARQAGLNFFKYSNYLVENYFSYNRDFGKHNISATVGNTYRDPGTSASLGATGSNIANNNIRNISVALSQTVSSANVGYADIALISYYGRLVYGFDDKYILSASMRRDGASNFGPNNRFGNFPGVGAAWRFSDEEFMKGLSFLSEGKLRAGWGRTGNNNIPAFLTDVFTYSGAPSGNLVYSFGSPETFVAGTSVNSLSNPNLRWEQTDQTDIGLDLGFLNNKLTLTVDWYNRKSSGLLVSVPLPTSNGVGGVGNRGSDIITNAADAQNKGIEISVGYRAAPTADFNYSINANASFNKNEVLSLGSEFQAPIQAGSFSQLNTITYTAKGSPIGAFYGFSVDRVARDSVEIAALNAKAPGGTYQDGLLPGDFIFKDLNGDGLLNDKDQKILGSPIPKVIYGFNATANYKSLDLNLVVAGVAGTKLVNAAKFTTANASTGHNATTAILDRWQKPGDVAALPRAGQNVTASGNLRPSDFFVEDGSFMRLRNLTIGYTLPKGVLSSFAANVLTRVRVYVAAQNLLTITNYTGYDPEVSTQGGGGNYIFQRGIDDGQLPQPRTFVAGVQLGF